MTELNCWFKLEVETLKAAVVNLNGDPNFQTVRALVVEFSVSVGTNIPFGVCMAIMVEVVVSPGGMLETPMLGEGDSSAIKASG